MTLLCEVMVIPNCPYSQMSVRVQAKSRAPQLHAERYLHALRVALLRVALRRAALELLSSLPCRLTHGQGTR